MVRKYIIFVVFIVLLNGACKREYEAENYNLQFFFNENVLKVDVNTGELILNDGFSKYQDNAQFTKLEKKGVVEAFEKYKIYNFKGSYRYYKKNLIIMPSNNFIIKVLKDGKVTSTISVAAECNSDDVSFLNFKEKNAILFKEEMIEILLKNLRVNKCLDKISNIGVDF